MTNLHILQHPLIQHKLTLLRSKDTPTVQFRALMHEVGMALAFVATADLPLQQVSIETPIKKTKQPMIKGKKLCLVSVLRAGNGLVDGMLQFIPCARVGVLGLYRDPSTFAAKQYCVKLPTDISKRDVIICDPMLATGNTSIEAVNLIKGHKPKSIRFCALLASQEGIANLHRHHPDLPIYVAGVDKDLNEQGYIVPGLGDAGDRLFGTK